LLVSTPLETTHLAGVAEELHDLAAADFMVQDPPVAAAIGVLGESGNFKSVLVTGHCVEFWVSIPKTHWSRDRSLEKVGLQRETISLVKTNAHVGRLRLA
jgi:hypothetical protein